MTYFETVNYTELFTVQVVTGQLADKPTRGQSSRGLVNSRSSQLRRNVSFKIWNI